MSYTSEPTAATSYRITTMNNARLVILLLLIAYIFSPTLLSWILDPEGAWYRPFIAWILVILLAFVMQIKRKNYHEFD